MTYNFKEERDQIRDFCEEYIPLAKSELAKHHNDNKHFSWIFALNNLLTLQSLTEAINNSFDVYAYHGNISSFKLKENSFHQLADVWREQFSITKAAIDSLCTGLIRPRKDAISAISAFCQLDLAYCAAMVLMDNISLPDDFSISSQFKENMDNAFDRLEDFYTNELSNARELLDEMSLTDEEIHEGVTAACTPEQVEGYERYVKGIF